MKTYKQLKEEMTQELYDSLMADIKKIASANFKQYNIKNKQDLQLNDEPMLVMKLSELKKHEDIYKYIMDTYKDAKDDLTVSISYSASGKYASHSLIDLYSKDGENYLHVYQADVSMNYRDLKKNKPFIPKKPLLVKLIPVE